MKIFFQEKNGFATIPTILALSGMILAIAMGIAAVSYTQTETSAAAEKSAAALDYAEVGAKDALMRIARDKNYSCPSIDCYSLDVATSGCASLSACAKVSVSTGAGTELDPKIITAKGVVQNKTRELETRVVFDASGFGELASNTWEEIAN
jgi:hypothetical protein